MSLGLNENNEFEKKKMFILEHSDFFLNGVSIWFHLTHEQLRKYQNILEWQYVVCNETIDWTIDIMDEFKDLIFEDGNPFNEINTNEKLPWSVEFIARFEDLWIWELLAQNDQVIGDAEIRKYFHNQLDPYIDEYLEMFNNRSNGLNSSGKTFGDAVEADSLNLLLKHKELQIMHPHEIEDSDSIDWTRLSQNEFLNWSAELIEKYIDQWDWPALSTNKSINRNLKLIKCFEDKIDWSKDKIDADGTITFERNNISSNDSIEWDSEILSTYVSRLNTSSISISANAKWNIDLLIQFADFWDYWILSLNKVVWGIVFPEFNNSAYLNPILDLILERRNINE